MPKVSPRTLRKYSSTILSAPIVERNPVSQRGNTQEEERTRTGPKVAVGFPLAEYSTASELKVSTEIRSDILPIGPSLAQGLGVENQSSVENDKATKSFVDEENSQGTSDYEEHVRSRYRYTPYPPGYGGPAHMRELRRVFTNAASSAKTTGAQKISRGEGEPYYSVSVHKTRFEKYEELMTELFGPGDILRGSSTQRKPRPKKVSTRLIFTSLDFLTMI